jgi:hypothetical protein
MAWPTACTWPCERDAVISKLRDRLHRLAAQRRANGLDLRGRQARQIGQRALADLGALAVGLTQQHGGG